METEERLDDMLTLKLYLSAGFRMKHFIACFIIVSLVFGGEKPKLKETFAFECILIAYACFI